MEVSGREASQSIQSFFVPGILIPSDLVRMIFSHLAENDFISVGLVSKAWNARVISLLTDKKDEIHKEHIRCLGIFLFQPNLITGQVENQVLTSPYFALDLVRRDLWRRATERSHAAKNYQMVSVLTDKFRMEREILPYLIKEGVQEEIYKIAQNIGNFELANTYAEALTDRVKKTAIKRLIFEKSLHLTDEAIKWYENIISIDPTYSPSPENLYFLIQKISPKVRGEGHCLKLLQNIYTSQRNRIAALKNVQPVHPLYSQASTIFSTNGWDLAYFLETGNFKGSSGVSWKRKTYAPANGDK